jgi:Ca2+-transporting ATPase
MTATGPWHTLTPEQALGALETSAEEGLTRAQVQGRLNTHGYNALIHEAGKPWWHILWTQFRNVLVGILAGAAIVSFLLGDVKDSIAILVIVFLNAALGFKQEYSAEQAMAALRKLSVPKARVRRNGRVAEVDARELVPGDIMLLEAGNLVPADGRLTVCAGLRVQESALTGESEGVLKQLDPVGNPDAAVGDRRNLVYMGTVVTYGRGEAVVTATGMQTELGRVAGLLAATEEEPTPLSRKIAHVGHVLIAIALGLIGLVALVGFWRGDSPATVFMTAVSMAVAAVPEGLPAVVTIALALGARRMLARQALIRSLPAVETLGAVTAICTDKTGTLTQNVMTVTCAALPDREVELSARVDDDIPGMELRQDLHLALGAAALCTDAELGGGRHDVIGDPTEAALVVAADRAGLRKADLSDRFPRIAEAPFDSDRKRMTTLHAVPSAEVDEPGADFAGTLRVLHPDARGFAFAKGAVGSVLDVSTRVLTGGRPEPLTDGRRVSIEAAAERLAGKGIRVLAVAYRALSDVPANPAPDDLERELVILGLVGMMDPLREDVIAAVRTCMDAGIRPVMITGDHPLMARHIAARLNLHNADTVLAGSELQGLSDSDLRAAVRTTSVFARVSPEHKLRIVDALQAEGGIVSMTGDGVNDAPALKSADIGVAMGVTGTDVAKEASDMILLDDRYTTIVSAVREGRVIFDNIKRFIRFILASNIGELFVMLLAPFFGLPLPLLPVQILWMNLVTDGLPALALGIEQAEGDVMKRPPRNPAAPIIDASMVRHVLWVGFFMAVLALAIGRFGYAGSGGTAPEAGAHHSALREPATWQTMLFTTMVFMQLFLAMAVRSTRDSLFHIGVFSNRPLVLAVGGTALLQLGVVYLPWLQGFFMTRSLTVAELAACIGLAAAVFLAVEAEKLVRRLAGSRASGL